MSSETRGKAIKARRLRHGIKSVRQFAEQSGVSREAITAAEDGLASESTYARLEAWLDSFEDETGATAAEEAASGPHMVTIRSSRGDVDVVVSGPIEDIEALTATVERLLRSSDRNDQGENG